MNFSHIVTIIFIIAKLLGYFPYSWYWVFAPVLVAIVLLALAEIGKEQK